MEAPVSFHNVSVKNGINMDCEKAHNQTSHRISDKNAEFNQTSNNQGYVKKRNLKSLDNRTRYFFKLKIQRAKLVCNCHNKSTVSVNDVGGGASQQHNDSNIRN